MPFKEIFRKAGETQHECLIRRFTNTWRKGQWNEIIERQFQKWKKKFEAKGETFEIIIYSPHFKSVKVKVK